jgi:tetratricopeptide (TPR) repeat protein
MGVESGGLREILSDLFPGHAPAMFHLLSCESCRAWATAALIEEHGIKLLLPREPGTLGGVAGAAPEMEPDSAAGLACSAALAANAKRLEGDLLGADAALGNALVYGAPPLQKAGYHRVMALIRWERGQFDDAESLLQQAANLYGEERQLGEEGATLTLLGLLRLDAGPPYERVAAALFPGLPALAGNRPWLAARGTLALAFAFASLGRPVEAEELLEGAREIASGVFNPEELIRLFWLEARVLCRLRGFERAESLLSSVRGKLLANGCWAEAVLVSFDLGLALAEAGKFDSLEAMAAELEGITASEPLLADACHELRALNWQAPRARFDRVELTALTQRRFFQRRGLGLRPVPFA